MFVHLVWTKLVFIPRPPAILNQLCGRGPRQRRRPLQQLLGKRDGVGFHQGAVLPVRRVHHLEANWVLNRWSGCCKSASQMQIVLRILAMLLSNPVLPIKNRVP